jgi:hypothetical protein
VWPLAVDELAEILRLRSWILAFERYEGRFDSSLKTRPVAVAPVEDLLVENNDGLVLSIGRNVVDQCVELRPFDRRENVCERVECLVFDGAAGLTSMLTAAPPRRRRPFAQGPRWAPGAASRCG